MMIQDQTANLYGIWKIFEALKNGKRRWPEQESTRARVSFSMKLRTGKLTLEQVFFFLTFQIFKKTYFAEHLRTITFESKITKG